MWAYALLGCSDLKMSRFLSKAHEGLEDLLDKPDIVKEHLFDKFQDVFVDKLGDKILMGETIAFPPVDG